MGPVLCRALNKILTERLARTRIHEAQRAFIRTDGCADNITLMDSILRDSKRKYKSLYIAQLDLTKAFDMVTHKAIEAALRGNNVWSEPV